LGSGDFIVAFEGGKWGGETVDGCHCACGVNGEGVRGGEGGEQNPAKRHKRSKKKKDAARSD